MKDDVKMLEFDKTAKTNNMTSDIENKENSKLFAENLRLKKELKELKQTIKTLLGFIGG